MNNPQGCYLGIRVLQLLQNRRESKKRSIIFIDCVWNKVMGKERGRGQFFYKC